MTFSEAFRTYISDLQDELSTLRGAVLRHAVDTGDTSLLDLITESSIRETSLSQKYITNVNEAALRAEEGVYQ